MGKSKNTGSKYILFTGLPGSGKSSTIKELTRQLEAKGQTVCFRDKVVEKYSTFDLYLYTLLFISPLKLVQIIWFWLSYPAKNIDDFSVYEYRFWNKKIALCKRMLLSYIVVNKEKPDYFIDESIEAQYRVLDLDREKEKTDQWSLYSGDELYFAVVNTPIEQAIDRAVVREADDPRQVPKLRKQWIENKPWFEEMTKRINQVSSYLNKLSHKENITVIKVDGTDLVKDNAHQIMKQIL